MMSDKIPRTSTIPIRCLYQALLVDYGILSSMISCDLRISF